MGKGKGRRRRGIGLERGDTSRGRERTLPRVEMASNELLPVRYVPVACPQWTVIVVFADQPAEHVPAAGSPPQATPGASCGVPTGGASSSARCGRSVL